MCVQIEDVISTVRDSNLKLTLAFGIGMHHAGLHERDRRTVEELFVNCKIQVGLRAPPGPRALPLIPPLISSAGPDRHQHSGLGRELPGPPGGRQGDGVLRR